MSRREQARAEAAFLRGDAGVDGVATDHDGRDAAEVERDQSREQLLRGRTWLGRELLTWLLWRSEAGEPLVEVEGAGLTVLFTGRITLRGLAGDVSELAARGVAAPYSAEVRRALDAGLLVHQARLRPDQARDDRGHRRRGQLHQPDADPRPGELVRGTERNDARPDERRRQARRSVDALVARTLETEWNAKLEAAARCRQEAQRFLQAHPPQLSSEDRARITRLAADLPALWAHPQTTAQDRKLLLRTLLADVTLTREPGADQVCPLADADPDSLPNWTTESPTGYRFGTLYGNKSKCNCDGFDVPVTVLQNEQLFDDRQHGAFTFC